MKLRYLILALLSCSLWGQGILAPILQGAPSGPPPTTVTFNTTHSSGNTSGSTNPVLGPLPFTGAGLTTGNYIGLIVGFQGTTATVASVCDGTGTNQCTGGSTYTNNSHAIIRNSTNSAQYWFTCNYQGSTGNGITVAITGSSTYVYVALVTATGNTTTATGCDDAYGSNSGTSGTAYSTGSMTNTTNAHDMLAGFCMNDAGGTYTAGTDGQGNSMTIQADDSGVSMVETFNESATHVFNPTATGPNTHWECFGAAVK